MREHLAIALPVFTASVLFAVLNLRAHILAAQHHKAANAIASGWLAGVFFGTAIIFLAMLPVAVVVLSIASIFIISLAVLGLLAGLLRSNPSVARNALHLLLGLFYLDSNRTIAAAAWQGISRFTYECLQTIIGYSYAQVLNMVSRTRVIHFGGATFSIKHHNQKHRGVSIGNYIAIILPGKNPPLTDDLFMHEYGHTFDSARFGPFYLLLIGIPSLISASLANRRNRAHHKPHSSRWYEQSADRHARNYLSAHRVAVENTLAESK
jgi:hypothetical protein